MKSFKIGILIGVLGIVFPLLSYASTPNLVISSDFVAYNYTQGDSTSNYFQQIMLFNQSSTDTIYYQISVPHQPEWLNTVYATDELPLYPSGTAGLGVSVDPTKVGPGSYSYDIGLSGNFSNSPKYIHVTLNVSGYAAPSVSYVQSPAESKNILHPGERATVYGKNISSSYEVWFQKDGRTFFAPLTRIGSMGNDADFYVPQLSGGSYSLLLVPTGKGSESNKINVNVISTNSSVSVPKTSTPSNPTTPSQMTQSEREALIIQLQTLLAQLIQQLILVLQQENH